MSVQADIPARGAVVGVDTGGTFTDVTMVDPDTGRIWTVKTPSTPEDPSLGFSQGIEQVIALSGMPPEAVGRVLHGTTVATNLILEAKGAPTAMLVTKGFRYVVEIGRQDVPRGHDLHSWVKPSRPVKPQHIWEIDGRLDVHGEELTKLDEAAVRSAAAEIVAAGIGAVAIVFINSYTNGAHEKRAAEILREAQPQLLVSVSSEIMPVFREYERSMTTNLNAYVMAAVSTYVEQLEGRLSGQAATAPLLLMRSSGGVASAKVIRDRPVETVLSGPAAGVVGAIYAGALAGERNLIGVDIGGTSADVSLIHQGELSLTGRGQVGSWPVGVPMVDLTTVGAGGGSIARIGVAGALTVGPESAGARPGPVCYSRGGIDPTVTDAHAALGHLPPYLLNGDFRLDIDAAREAIRTKIAEPLNMSVEDAARGILQIADNNMVGAIRVVSLERGFDPRDFVLVPFGGAGPLHGGSLARAMGIRRVLIPPLPGVLSAVGLLTSDIKAEFARTSLQRSDAVNYDALSGVFRHLTDAANIWLDEEKVPEGARQTRRMANLRYRNQGYELTVPWRGEGVDPASVEATIGAFHEAHERRYGFSQPDTIVEFTTVRVDAVGRFHPPKLPPAPTDGSVDQAITGRSRIRLATRDVDAFIYDRARLPVGEIVEGPCIVTQLDATTLVLDRQTVEVLPCGGLLLREEGGA